MTEQNDSSVVYDEGVRLFVVPSGARVEISSNNYIETEIVLDVGAIVDRDLEGFLDLVSLEATDTELLMDISYKPKSVTPQDNIVFVVTGDVSEILNMEADRNE